MDRPGPKREAAAYDFMIQAMGGLMSITGERDGLPGGGPQKVGVPIVDIMTGMYAAVGVLAALARRDETGHGDYIDLAMLDVQSAFLANQAMNWLVSGNSAQARRQPSSQHPAAGCFPLRRTALSRWRSATTASSAELAEILGHPEWTKDERFATNPARVRNHPLLDPLLRARIRKPQTPRSDCAAGRRRRALLADQHGAGGVC